MTTQEVRRKVRAATDSIEIPRVNGPELLVAAQRARGSQIRDRLVLAAVAVLVMGVAVTYAVRGAERMPAADDSKSADGSAQALAALAIEQLDWDQGSPVEQLTDTQAVMSATVYPELDEGMTGSWLSVLAVRDQSTIAYCGDGRKRCFVLPTDRGEVEVAWERPRGDQVPGSVFVSWMEPGTGNYEEVRFFTPRITGDPRALDLRVDVEQLAALLTDPRLGFRTSEELADVRLPGLRTR